VSDHPSNLIHVLGVITPHHLAEDEVHRGGTKEPQMPQGRAPRC
jgi:hypothetical protein